MTVVDLKHPWDEDEMVRNGLLSQRYLKPSTQPATLVTYECDQNLSPWYVVCNASPLHAHILSHCMAEPVWQVQVAARIGELLHLGENWDSYGAPSIDRTIVEHVTRFLVETMTEGTPIPSIVPLSDGGLQVEWHNYDIDLEVTFDGEDQYRLFFEDHRRFILDMDQELRQNPAYSPEPIIDLLGEILRRSGR